DLQGHFQRQTTRLLEHQTHVQDMWDQDYAAHHPPEQFMSGDEIDREVDEAVDFLTARDGSPSQGGH
ncbi:hypothetical protein A2U01_0084344, partial [Trifolium medium]|nr:hypothetical protein [Trifolium medium]